MRIHTYIYIFVYVFAFSKRGVASKWIWDPPSYQVDPSRAGGRKVPTYIYIYIIYIYLVL